MFLNLQHPHIRYIAPPAEGGSDTADTTPPAKPNGNGEETDWEAKYKEALGHSRDWEKKAKANKAAADELQQLKEPNCPKPKRPPSTSKSLKPRTPPTRRKNSRTNGRRRSPRKPACPSHCSTAPRSKKCRPTARRSPTTSPTKPSPRCTPPPNPTSRPHHPAHPATGSVTSSSNKSRNNPLHRKKV